MKKLIILFLTIILFISCDPSGNIFITNDYPYQVHIIIYYENNGIEDSDSLILKQGTTYAPAAMGHIEHKNIIKIVIKDTSNNLLAIYSSEEIDKLKQAAIKRNITEYRLSENGILIY